ncbi:MAG TPA: flagellar biosynthetic protein FliO [Rectinemataceae bacterium]|nr:flagellar biosynthetic protein FliO [Rectinemataceae bacterium]
MALGSGAVAGQGTKAPTPEAGGVVGTAQTVDETTLVIGDRATAAAAGSVPAGPSTLAYFLRMVVVLALVLGAIYGAYRLMRRASRPRIEEDPTVKVLATASLGPGKAVHVLSVGNQAFLIGVTDSSISLISEVADRDLVDSLALKAAMAPKAREGLGGFGEALAALLAGKGRAAGKRGPQPGDGDFLARQRERLRKF